MNSVQVFSGFGSWNKPLLLENDRCIWCKFRPIFKSHCCQYLRLVWPEVTQQGSKWILDGSDRTLFLQLAQNGGTNPPKCGRNLKWQRHPLSATTRFWGLATDSSLDRRHSEHVALPKPFGVHGPVQGHKTPHQKMKGSAHHQDKCLTQWYEWESHFEGVCSTATKWRARYGQHGGYPPIPAMVDDGFRTGRWHWGKPADWYKQIDCTVNGTVIDALATTFSGSCGKPKKCFFNNLQLFLPVLATHRETPLNELPQVVEA